MQLTGKQKGFVQSRLATDWTTLDLHTPQTHATFPADEPLSPDERTSLESLFISREHALRAGITIRGASFPVHQWETTRGVRLVYGRRGDALSGCGACVCRVVFDDGLVLHAAITYRFPSVSANAVTKLLEFVGMLGNVDLDGADDVGGTVEPETALTKE